MRAEIDHRLREARVFHDRHGDQHLAIEIALAGLIVARIGNFASAARWLFSCQVHRRTLMSLLILISSARAVKSSFVPNHSGSQAIQWFAAPLGGKDVS